MDEDESAASSKLGQAKDWIGNAFRRVGSSFRERKSVSQEQSYCSPSSPGSQHGHRSLPELSMFGVDLPNFNRLKDVCARAFGANGFCEQPDRYAGIQTKHSEENRNAEISLRDLEERKLSTHSIRQRISMSTTFESETNGGHMVRLSSVEMEIEQTVSGSVLKQQESVMSGDSGVDFDYRDSVDTQSGYSIGLNNSALRKTKEASDTFNQSNFERKHAAEKSGKLKIKGPEQDFEEKFSRNYSMFCEKLNDLQSNAEVTSEQQTEERARSFTFSFNLRKSFMRKRNKTKEPCEENMLKVHGRLKLSLQYFQNCRQLRVILLCAETDVEDNKRIFIKISLTGNNSTQKVKTRKMRISSGTVEFNESFHMVTDADDLIGYTMQIQLCKVSKVLQRPSTVGEALIILEELDINLDTTMWVKLRDPKSSKQVSKREDLEITSENKSIHAEAMALLKQTGQIYQRSPALPRCRSLPYMSRYAVSTDTNSILTSSFPRIQDLRIATPHPRN